MDFRFRAKFADMGICNKDPKDPLGIVGAKLFTPGNPARSIIPLRMSSRPQNQMPPLATNIVHTLGVNAIKAWISQTTACP